MQINQLTSEQIEQLKQIQKQLNELRKRSDERIAILEKLVASNS